MKTIMTKSKSTAPTLFLSCPDDILLRLVTVLQSGFFRSTAEGESILSFLMSIEGFSEKYIVDEVQTIFFNGDALDDMEATITGEKAVIALSAAMPGLAGAILRKGSPVGALKKSRTDASEISGGSYVDVQVKLFNTVALDRGPELFTHGIRLKTIELLSFLDIRPSIVTALGNLVFDGHTIHASELKNSISTHPEIFIQIH